MKLLFAAAFAGAALSAAAATAQPLPDFPQAARPGECYARVPTGAPPGAPGSTMGGGQRVWTIERGAGPAAVWRFDQRPPTGTTGFPGPGGNLDWAVVDCATGRPLGPVAQAAPPLPVPPPPGQAYAAVPPPPPVMLEPGPRRERRMVVRPRAPVQPAPEVYAGPPPPFPHGPMMGGPGGAGPAPHGPMAQGPAPHGPMLHGPTPFAPMPHGSMPHGPMPHGSMLQGPAPHGPMLQGPMLQGPAPFVFPPAPDAYAQAPAAPRWFGDRFLTWPGKR